MAETLTYHIPGNTLYLGKCPHPPHQCRQPQLCDFYAGLIVVGDSLVSVAVEGDTAVLWNERRRVTVKFTSDVKIAAQSFAAAFGGKIVTEQWEAIYGAT